MIVSYWTRYGYLLRWFISLLMLVIVIFKIDFRVLGELTRTVTWLYYIFGTLLALLANVLASYRWKLLTTGIDFTELFRLNLISNFYSFLSGTTVLADFFKLAHVGIPSVRKADLISSMLVDKGLAFIGTTLCLLIGVSLADPAVKDGLLPFSLTLVAVSCIALVVVRTKAIMSLGVWLARTKVLHAFNRRLRLTASVSIFQHAVMLMSSNRRVAGAILITLLFNGAFTCIYLVWAQVFDINVSIGTYVTLAVLTQIVGLVPLSIAGVGARDLTTIAVLVNAGVPEATAALAALSFYPIVLSIAGLGFITVSRSLSFSRSN